MLDLAAISGNGLAYPAETASAVIYRAFVEDPTLPAIALLDEDQRPVGIAIRQAFLLRMVEAPDRDALAASPVSEVMDGAPIVLERLTSLDALAAVLQDVDRTAMASSFIVTDDQRYAGIGAGVELMRLVTDHLQHQALEAEGARREAAAAAKGKDRFFANMTHELRTPLNGVIGFGQLLEAEAHGPLGAPEYKLYAKDIVASGNHLISIITDILDLAKIEAGRVELHERFVDLRDLTGRSLRMIGPLAANKSITLHVDKHDPQWTVRADERRLQQAIVNLLSNAIKFSSPGGNVGIDFGANAGWVWIEVWDEGCGVSEQDIGRLFKPFTQIANGAGGEQEGTGLGLTITRALMQAHGGDVEFASAPNQGARVRLLLPRSRLLANKFSWSVQSRVEFIDPPEAEAS